MGTASRSAKPTKGGTAWQTGEPIDQTPLESDFANIYNEFNGNIDNDNIASGAAIDGSKLASGSIGNTQIASSAAIDPAKLSQTAAGLDCDIVDDHADDDTTWITTRNPGDSSSNTNPTNLEQELEILRYVLQRQNLGVNAKITSGSTSVAWFDGVKIGPNLLYNPSFSDNNAAPSGWTVNGASSPSVTPTALSSTDLNEGRGRYIAFVDSTGADSDGLSQSLTLNRSTHYLVAARVKDNTGDVRLVTTGATGTFGNISQTSDTGAWATLAGVVQTDTTPASLVVRIGPGAGTTNYDFDVAWAGVWEVSQDDLGKRDTGGITLYKSSTSTEDGTGGFSTLEAALDATVVPPSHGYKIVVQLTVQCEVDRASDNHVLVELDQSVDGAGFAAVAAGSFRQESGSGTGTRGSVQVTYVNESPTPGSTYRYVPDITPSETNSRVGLSSRGDTHSLLVQLVRS
jgi:hypothetical protein